MSKISMRMDREFQKDVAETLHPEKFERSRATKKESKKQKTIISGRVETVYTITLTKDVIESLLSDLKNMLECFEYGGGIQEKTAQLRLELIRLIKEEYDPK